MSLAVLVASGLALAAVPAHATSTTTIQFGDADGFGIGTLDGASFAFGSVTSTALDGVTDSFGATDITLDFLFDFAGQVVTGATLSFFHGGAGSLTGGTPGRVSISGTEIGTFNSFTGSNIGVFSSFALGPSQFGLIKTLAPTTVSFDVDQNDAWVLDFARLSVTLDDAPAAIPLPASLPLVLSGLLGLGWFGRRARRS